MLSLIQRQKLTHLFDILDKDKNEILQERDFTHLGENICVALNWEPGSPDHESVMEKCKHIYTTIFNSIPHKQADAITLDLWLHYFDFALTMDDEEIIDEFVDLFLNKVFEMFDQNHDGSITENEYIDMFRIYGLNITEVPKGFESLDTDHDKKINKRELENGFKEFLTSPSREANGNWTFGSWE